MRARKRGPVSRHGDVVNAVDVADRIAIPVQDQGRHGLLLLQFIHIAGQLIEFFLVLVGEAPD